MFSNDEAGIGYEDVGLIRKAGWEGEGGTDRLRCFLSLCERIVVITAQTETCLFSVKLLNVPAFDT